MPTDDRSATPVPPALARLVREHRGRFELPNLRVHVDDEMFRFSQLCCPSPAIGEMAYYRAGIVIADTLRTIAKQWCPSGPQRVLDFACGYGRSLRFTIQDFGRDHVWGSEILPGAVRYIDDELGAHAVTSATQPEDLDLEGPFDVIFVASLFSHLPEKTFARWLRALHERLAPSGLLVFSVHDESMLTGDQELSPEGIFFGPASEIDSLDTQDYGVTIVSEHFVANAIGAATGHRNYRRCPTALCFQQDLYLVPADHEANLDQLVVRHGPQGDINACRIDEDHLYLQGWAMTQDVDVQVNSIDVRLNDQLVARGRPTTDRPDVAAFWRASDNPGCIRSGWEARVDLPFEPPAQSIITWSAHVTDGSHGVFWSSELAELARHTGTHVAVAAPVLPLSTMQQVQATWQAEGLTGVAHGISRRLTRAAHALTSATAQGLAH
jgi:SAM-dependent methyltransferase